MNERHYELRYRVDPRDITSEKAARRLGLTTKQFELLSANLFERGFPKPDQTTGMYDLYAIEQWMNVRSGLGAHSQPATPLQNAQDVFSQRARRLLDG